MARVYRRVGLEVEVKDYEVIKRAADAQHKSVSAFLREAALRDARIVLRDAGEKGGE